MGSMTVGEWEQFMSPAPDDPAERAKANQANKELFADRVISWNLTEGEDKPVPVTLAAIRAMDRPFFTTLHRLAARPARRGPYLRARILQWREQWGDGAAGDAAGPDHGGDAGSDGDGDKPWELWVNDLILAMCDRFRCLPSAAEAEDVTVLKMLQIERLAHGGPEAREGGEDWP